MKTGLLLLLGTIIGAGLAWITMQAVQANCFKARYADAVVYAGATDFVFELASGEKFSVRSSHEGIPISGSAPLLGTAHDGPAEAATDRLGRIHLLCVANDGIREVEGMMAIRRRTARALPTDCCPLHVECFRPTA